MKTVYFQNRRNLDKFECPNTKDVIVIEGIEYIRVFKLGTNRDCLMRKDQLKKINIKEVHS